MGKTNESTTHKDIFATLGSLTEIDAEKEALRSKHDIDHLVANLKKENLTDKSVFRGATIQVFNTFQEESLPFQDLWLDGTLMEDLKQHSVLSAYYNIQYLMTPITESVDDFLYFTIKSAYASSYFTTEESEEDFIRDNRIRILKNVNDKKTKWISKLLNFTEAKQKQKISYFLPLIFISFIEYLPKGAATPLENYDSHINLDKASASKSLTRKAEETIKSISILYQMIFNRIFNTSNTFTAKENEEQLMSDFVLYYYKLERAYGADLLYNSLIFLKDNKDINIEFPDKKSEETLQKFESFLLDLQRFPNVMARCSNIKYYYQKWKDAKYCYPQWENSSDFLKDLCNLFLQFEKVWLLTIIEYYERDLDAISENLFNAISENLQIKEIFSAYKKKYPVFTDKDKPDLSRMYFKQQFMPYDSVPNNTSDLPYELFSSDWKSKSPYNYILDPYFKKRYSPEWWGNI